MRSLTVWLLWVLIMAPGLLCSQGVLVDLYEEEYTSQTLSGLVLIGDAPDGVMGVLVEVCGPGWKDSIHSTRTDSKGHFSFPTLAPENEDLYYLRLSADGVNTTLVKVRIKPSGPKRVTLHMEFSN